MAEIKQLKEKKTDEIFYPVTVGEAVIYQDRTNADLSEVTMDSIFDWNRNYIDLIPTKSNNYVIVEEGENE